MSFFHSLLAIGGASIQAYDIVASNVSETTVTLSWTNGSGQKRVVFMKPSSAISAHPSDSTFYAGNTVLGLGDSISGAYCVYNGLDATVNVTYLVPGTTYHIRVYEYDGLPDEEIYNTDTATDNPISFLAADSVSSPQTVYGSNLKTWINGRTSTNKNGTGIFNAELGAITTDDSNALSLTKQGSGSFFFNGTMIYIPSTVGYIKSSDKAYYNFLHNGSGFTIAFRLGVITALETNWGIISNSGSTTTFGMTLNYDNRSGVSRTHALVFQMLRGSSGQLVQNVVVQNFFSVGDLVSGVINYDGTTLKVYKDGVEVSSTNDAFANVATDATYDTNFMRIANGGNYATDGLLKQLIVCDIHSDSSQLAYLNSYLSEGSENIVIRGKARIYTARGQSNMDGRTGTAPAKYQTDLAYIGNQNGGSVNSTYKLLLHTYTGGASATLGPDAEFCYLMKQHLGSVIFLCKFSEAGSPMYVDPVLNDWNYTHDELLTQSNNALLYSAKYAKYKYGFSPVYKGDLWRQGEADALESNVNYKVDYQNYIKETLDMAIAQLAAGFLDEIDARFYCALVDNNFSPSRPFRDDIVQDQMDALDDFLTDFPAYSATYGGGHYFSTTDIPNSDGTHFTSPAGMAEQGLRFFNAAKDYAL